MGIYTDSHGNTYSINIGDPELQMISNNPDFHFCWMNDNDSIQDTKSNYYEEKTEVDETINVLKESILELEEALLWGVNLPLRTLVVNLLINILSTVAMLAVIR